MLRANRTLWAGLLLLAGALVAGPVAATPLNLQPGDLIDTIEWDAISPGGGGNFLVSTQELLTAGQITSVDVQRAPAFPPTLTSIPQSGVTFSFGVQLTDANIFPGGNLLTTWAGSSLTDPDVTVVQNGNTILTGDFLGSFFFGGFLNQSTLVASADISVTGGDQALVDAIGAVATLKLSASVFGFNPNLPVLLADTIAGNENFFVEFSGTLLAPNAAPFVPEPSAAVLAGIGLLGVLAAGRRLSANRNA